MKLKEKRFSNRFGSSLPPRVTSEIVDDRYFAKKTGQRVLLLKAKMGILFFTSVRVGLGPFSGGL